jgi:hypothetical protein
MFLLDWLRSARVGSVQGMQDEYGTSSTRGDEDDWFSGPGDEPGDVDTIVWEDPEPTPSAGRRSSPIAGPWVAIAALVGAIALIVAGILLAQSLTDSDDSSPTPTATTPATTPATTTTPTTPETTPDTPATTPSTGDIVLPEGVTLRSGDSGPGVEALQQALAKLGYDPGAVDGDFGPSTQAAVVAFQTAEDISADGVVGQETLNALGAALSTG